MSRAYSWIRKRLNRSVSDPDLQFIEPFGSSLAPHSNPESEPRAANRHETRTGVPPKSIPGYESNPAVVEVNEPDVPGYDIIGDVHGCAEELLHLIDLLGYRFDGTHPDGRKLVFVGDLTDRGPQSLDVLRFVLQV